MCEPLPPAGRFIPFADAIGWWKWVQDRFVTLPCSPP